MRNGSWGSIAYGRRKADAGIDKENRNAGFTLYVPRARPAQRRVHMQRSQHIVVFAEVDSRVEIDNEGERGENQQCIEPHPTMEVERSHGCIQLLLGAEPTAVR